MKRTLAITAAAVLTLSLAACGAQWDDASGRYGTTAGGLTATDTMHNDGGVTNGTGVNDGAAAGTASRSARGGAAGSAALHGVDYSDAAAVHRAALAGDRYARMLENGRVHDSDGFLLDGENAAYPTL